MIKKTSISASTIEDVPRIVLVDANVFFAPRLRDLFMHFHEAGLISIHWTKTIELEWSRNVVAKQNAEKKAIQTCLQGMRDAAPDWEVNGYEKHMEAFEPVDQKDRHVAAAAYKLSMDKWPGQPVALVTKNVKDFPTAAFEDTTVTRYSMTTFLDGLYQQSPDKVLKVVDICRKKLQAPKLSKEVYVAVLVKNGCFGLASAVATHWKVECPDIDKNGTLYYKSDQ